MDRFVCIHGHFYQPPRENPWLEAIEVQDSAAPFHDWNARIQAECYAPNGACRVRRDFVGPVTAIVNNYRDISFNFGPTLLSWMEKADPEAYGQILKADRESAEARGGHGNALAQAYNHMIMPLASPRDQRTQVYWGAADFTHRFGRRPEGMWLPETAVDRATLKCLADQGIAFTVLSPRQARRVRSLAGGPPARRSRSGRKATAATDAQAGWHDVGGGRIDPTQPYWYDLGDGHGVAIFFYDGPVSGAVAFEGLLSDGRRLGERLLGVFPERAGAKLVSIATDGESYGHHHRFGDMALAAAVRHIQDSGRAQLTNYAEFLARHPPTHEVQLFEPSAWSCAHGVGRWSEDCGCRMAGGTQQRWRRPLRDALDHLRAGLDAAYEAEGRRLLRDPWAARDAYVWVLLDPSEASRDQFLAEHGRSELSGDDATTVWSLLEMQRHGMLMYTSCGWFFDDVGGIEGVQILRYAARAMQLGERFGVKARAGFLDRLGQAPSSDRAVPDGKKVFEARVANAVVDPDRILARHAISTCLDPPAERSEVFCYAIEQRDYLREAFGPASLAVGRVLIRSRVTGESAWAAYAALHFGEHDFSCKIHRFGSIKDYEAARARVLEAFRRGSLKETVVTVEAAFPGSTHDLRDLFLEERRAVVSRVLRSTLDTLGEAYERIFNQNRKLLGFLREIEIPIPDELGISAGYVVKRHVEELVRRLAGSTAGVGEVLRGIGARLAEAERLGLRLPRRELELALQGWLERVTAGLDAEHGEEALGACLEILDATARWGLNVDTWRAENAVFRFLSGAYRKLEEAARLGEARAHARLQAAVKLARRMGFEA